MAKNQCQRNESVMKWRSGGISHRQRYQQNISGSAAMARKYGVSAKTALQRCSAASRRGVRLPAAQRERETAYAQRGA